MKQITEYIDAYYLGLYPSFKYWGLAELTDKSKDRFPVTIPDRVQVSLEKRFDALIWHREITADQVENEELSYGMTTLTQFTVTLRTIVAYKVELGEEFKYEFATQFPKDIDLPGFDFMNVLPFGLNVDHEQIAQVEEIHTQYEKHRLCWNLFTLENNFQFVLCEPTSP